MTGLHILFLIAVVAIWRVALAASRWSDLSAEQRRVDALARIGGRRG